MKIAIATYGLYLATGGTERFVATLANEMTKRGHTVYIYANDHEKQSSKQAVFALDNKVKVRLCSPILWHDGKQQEIIAVRKELVANAIDVFLSPHSSGMHLLWLLCCLGTGVPFICSERSDPLFTEKVTWNKAGRNTVLAYSDFIHELLPIHSKAVPEMWQNKVRVIPNALPDINLNNILNNDQLAKRDQQKTILFLARYIKGKRADLLIRAFALLAKDFQDWQLKLVGHGPEKANLVNLVKDLNLSEQIQICEQKEAFSEYAKASIYCLPTEMEGFPMTVLEAMAFALPVVGIADCKAMTSLIKNADNGLLAEKASPESLAKTLKLLLESPELCLKLGQNALREAKTNYEHTKIFDNWEKLFAEAVKIKGQTAMQNFKEDPFANRDDLFASMARLSAFARKEYILRGFAEPMLYSPLWFKEKLLNLYKNMFKIKFA